MMIVMDLGTIVSSKLGEPVKLVKMFRKVAQEDCISFIDEFDSLIKVRGYSQDHGEMKRVVNTVLKLFDYLPQSSMVIAATNQKEMLNEALLRRFDISISLELPEKKQIEKLINLVLKEDQFVFDKKVSLAKLIESVKGLSYYSIQKTLINAIKRSLFAMKTLKALKPKIDTPILEGSA